ncbi:hypothetical protein ACFVUS_26720 [Nocardia sp. NPDC058058]|uniref:HflX-like GTP-binding protein n=1 Tax=Nocardia sp. NPDC058058 TaxID=3346317 RepID=UPI0036D9FB01
MSGKRSPRDGGRNRRRAGPAGGIVDPQQVIAGADVIVAGLFSAKRKDHLAVMAEVATQVARLGGHVVETFIQRRGVSGGKKGNAPGGVPAMSEPYSSRTLMSTGKVREIAEACTRANAAAVVFSNELSARQRAVLATICGCQVYSHDELARLEPELILRHELPPRPSTNAPEELRGYP